MAQKVGEPIDYRVLCSLRKIIRAVHIHSKKLNAAQGLTTPQLICLSAVVAQKDLTLSQLSKEVNLSGSTVTGIVDRLEQKKLLARERSSTDRRKIFIRPLEAGQKLVKKAPSLLQEKFSERLGQLSEKEQNAIADSLELVVSLMKAEDIDASPNLIPGLNPTPPIRI